MWVITQQPLQDAAEMAKFLVRELWRRLLVIFDWYLPIIVSKKLGIVMIVIERDISIEWHVESGIQVDRFQCFDVEGVEPCLRRGPKQRNQSIDDARLVCKKRIDERPSGDDLKELQTLLVSCCHLTLMQCA